MEPKTINVDSEKLEDLSQKLSLHFWGKRCDIPVLWNGRLTKSMGRFMFSSRGRTRTALRIELSKHAVRFIPPEIFIAVLLHELCHYHLFIQGQPFEDGHPVFEEELRRVGAISTNVVQLPQKGFELYCSKCHERLGSRKRMNTKHYLSACCKAQILKKEAWLGECKYPGEILKHSKVRLSSNHVKKV
ncbi:SprT-like domain-containing protein [Bacillus horti]|uniref:SprT-like protein n=1 Tax=Caldalkalibacillus horti TaxID=77523 RepID=A0ABT9VVT7_9BACI|nr:SprT-like domain-containing protein [Bacillus horti]MDQ0165111.1 SprT-like protein [Bacillus horti]